mgnify:CR=1
MSSTHHLESSTYIAIAMPAKLFHEQIEIHQILTKIDLIVLLKNDRL